jgi:hypothetical protein
MRLAVVPALMVLFSLTAQADPLSDINKALSTFNQSLSKATRPAQQPMNTAQAAPNMPVITPEQKEKIAKALAQRVADERIKAMIAEASPTIAAFVEKLSCIADGHAASALNVYAAPGTNFQMIFYPMVMTPYHNKGSCLSVVRLQGWSAPARNALKFEVVYVADDSGESAKTHHVVIKQPDGEWLFSN